MRRRKSAAARQLATAPVPDGVMAPPPSSAPIDPAEPAILLDFPHGLGDLVQLSIAIRHLKEANPETSIDVVCDDGRVRSVTPWERKRWGYHDRLFDPTVYRSCVTIPFDECPDDVLGFPSSKAYRCVTQLFGLVARPDWFGYACVCGDRARKRAADYFGHLCGAGPNAAGRFPVVLVHYQGFSSRMQKDLSHEVVAELGASVRARRRAYALLDMDKQSPLVDQRTVFAPIAGHPVWANPAYADPETLLAMIELAELLVAIDSGPLHLAGCSTTPTLGVWTHHHPVRYFDFAPNVLHLVPMGHHRHVAGPRSLQTFKERYRHSVYSNQVGALIEETNKLLDGDGSAGEPSSQAIPGLRSKAYDENYYREHLLGGLDYLGHGEWQRQYGRWLARCLDWTDRRILDVGCACGSIMRGLGEARIVVQGIDVSEFMLWRGRTKWPDMAHLLHCCDAVNLHLFPDASWDGLHAAQVAEHWRPELVPFILRELARVTRPGGLFFCALDTEELFAKHGRGGESEDPTHICIKPLAWWHTVLGEAGWKVRTADFLPALETDPETFLQRYDWPLWVAERRADQE